MKEFFQADLTQISADHRLAFDRLHYFFYLLLLLKQKITESRFPKDSLKVE
jgi:hypothetical protein